MGDWPIDLNTIPLPALVAVSHPLTKEQVQHLEKFGSGVDQVAFKAGWALILGDQESAHEFAQSIEGKGRPRNGDYWHAILHRREPDYSNAKYWFRSVGDHPVFPRLSEQAYRILTACQDIAAAGWMKKLSAGGWDAFAFVDFCQACAGNEASPLSMAAREIQWTEMLVLLSESADAAGLRLDLPEPSVEPRFKE